MALAALACCVPLMTSLNVASASQHRSLRLQAHDDINVISSEALAAAYAAHWQDRLVVSVRFTRREDWCRSSEVAAFKSETLPR
jgi:hypothetical protein